MTSSLGVTLYNPDLLSKEDLVRGFIARRLLLDELVDDLRRTGRDGAPQHHLVLGQRGLGKTMLLRRLAYAIADDPELREIWQPLVFPEEQYNVAGLGDFWLNCVDALGDAFEQAGRREWTSDLDARVEQLGPKPDEDAALALLLEEADRVGRRLVLLVDNIDLVLDRIGKDREWPFRRLLSEEQRLLVIGASSRALEAFYDHGRAFYDFFRVHELGGLDEQETFALLGHLAANFNAPNVKRLLAEQPARLRTLRLLTGGNPRTVTLLFRIFQQGADGDVGADLEHLLDLYTPLYKARFEELAPQAQKVVDAMALHWDPMTAAALAADTGLQINLTSAQLKRLEDIGVVEKVPWFGEKKTAFQIAERFFNIWYLMRASRRVRRKLIWLVKFLEAWFTEEELRTRAESHLTRDAAKMGAARYAELSFAYAQVAPGRLLRSRLEHAGLRVALADARVRDEMDLSDLAPALLDKKARMEAMQALAAAVPGARSDWCGIDPHDFWRRLGGSPFNSFADKKACVESLGEISADRLREIDAVLKEGESTVRSWQPDDPGAAIKLQEAFASGEMADVLDWEVSATIGGAQLAAAVMSWGYAKNAPPEILERVEAAYREMAKELGLAGHAWAGLGDFLQSQRRYLEAEAAFRRALEAAPDFSFAWAGLGVVLYALRRDAEAKSMMMRALKLEPSSADHWISLGNVLSEDESSEAEAEAAYRRGLELEPDSAWGWRCLGLLLAAGTKRYDEAETAFRRAIELDPKDFLAWTGLGDLLSECEKRAEAEAAYRRALELQPDTAAAFGGLGHLLLQEPGRMPEGATYLLKALRQSPSREWDERILRVAIRQLASDPDTRNQALSSAREMVEILPRSQRASVTLAEVFVRHGQWSAAREILERTGSDLATAADEELIEFCAVTVVEGHLKELLAALERVGAHERWRPLYEALRAIDAGGTKYLRRVAPEVRGVAKDIYKTLKDEIGHARRT
jgi:tetratricopeptide (TPR) repeat protein